MKDKEDLSLVLTALRETHEEIGLDSDDVRILGQFVSLPNLDGTTKVTAFVASIGSIDLKDICFNPDEVSSIFAVEINQLLQTREQENFRNSGMIMPNWRVGEHRIWGIFSTQFRSYGVYLGRVPFWSSYPE